MYTLRFVYTCGITERSLCTCMMPAIKVLRHLKGNALLGLLAGQMYADILKLQDITA